MKNNSEKFLILAVSLGGFLEWYEIGVYIYWPLIILGDLVTFEIPAAEAINTGLVLATGFFSRTLGGWLFGRWGDIKGRKIPFAWSIMCTALPSVCLAFLPSFLIWSIFSTVLFTFIKFVQGIPAGGELPGAICFLAENGNHQRRRYLCSFTFVGPQLGLLFSLIICISLKILFPQKELLHFWWRLIFFISGIIGILGLFLRKKLHESAEFESSKHHQHILKSPIKELFKMHAGKVGRGFLISIFQVVSFSVLTILPSKVYQNIFNLSNFHNLLINISSLATCAILPPVIGRLSILRTKIPLFQISAIGMLIFFFPFYDSLKEEYFLLCILLNFLMILFYSIQAALLPSLLASLFPIRMRYTGIGFSFNVCDGIFWGIIPIISSILIHKAGNGAIFSIFLPIGALIFLLTYNNIKIPKTNP